MKLKIVIVPNPLLRQKSKPVAKQTPGLKNLVGQMINLINQDANENRLGVGLSAVQVGKPLRLFVAYSTDKNQDLVFINPKITWRSKKLTTGLPERKNKYEGCLSVPGVYGLVKRHNTINLNWLDLKGKKHHQKFSGFLASIIQHEYDHLNGVLFVDRVLAQKGKLYKVVRNKEGQEELAELQLT